MRQEAGEFKIDTGIPIPTAIHFVHKYPTNTMKVGESFFVSAEDDPAGVKVRSSLCVAQRRSKGKLKFTVRKVDGGFRAWRTK